MPPDVSSCAAKAGFTKPKIRKRSSKRQDTNATREMFIVFFTVKIETPRDANTHDGHVKSRGISPPRGLRCLFGQRRLPARSSRQLAANTICIPAFRLPKRTFATGPMLSILGTRARPARTGGLRSLQGRFHHRSVVIWSAGDMASSIAGHFAAVSTIRYHSKKLGLSV